MKKVQSPKEESRREFMVKAGKFAIYTPPALMLLMHPSKNALAASGRCERRPRRPPIGGQRPRFPRRPPIGGQKPRFPGRFPRYPKDVQ